MKVKKLISMFLVLSMVVSCLTALPFTTQASDVVAPLTNLIPQGDMEDSTATFTVKGTPSYVTDKALTDNENNKVLKIDGSSASSNATNLTLKSLTPMTAGRTYYIDFDYKIILGSSVRVRNAAYGPAIVANNGDANTWYKFSKTIAEDYTNIITPDADTYYQDIVVGTGKKGTELYIDNLVFYDVTDAVEIAANTDAAVEIVNAEGMQTVNGKLMANKGSIASFKVETEYGYSVSAVSVNGTVLTPDSEGVYSFTVAESANAITVTTARELVNLIPQGDMEDGTAAFTVKGTPSYVTDKALTDNENNKVLKIDGSSASTSATNLTLKSLTPMTAGRTYYIDFDYKIILDSNVRVRNAAYGNAVVTNKSYANSWYRLSEMYNSEKYNNVLTPTEDTYYQDIIVGTGEIGTELYIDNLVFYDITDAVEIAANTDAAVEIVNAEGMQTVNGKLMANKGSIASFKVETEYGYSVSAVSVNGTVLTPDSEGVYSFTVAESANAITVTTARELVNLIPQGDMEDGTAAFTVKGTPSYVTDKALTDNENNKVLKIDGSSASTSATNLTLKSLTPMTAGRTYYIDFDYKIILNSHVRVRNASYGNAVVANNGYANSWYRLSEMYNSEKYNNVLTPTEDTYYQDIIVGTGEIGTELYIDNLVFYDVTDAYRIELPEGVTITDGGVSMGSVGFAFPGRTVSFTVDGTPDSVMINGNVVTGTDNTYSFTMPQSEVTVLVVSGQSEESTVKYAVTAKKPYAIFDSAATVTLIVAEYETSGALKDAYISTVTGTAGQKIDLTEIEAFKDIENWSAKTIYTWSDLISLNPIRSACIMEEL